MSRSKYTDDEIIVLLWLFKISNYSPSIPKDLLLLLNRVTPHSIDSLVLYLSNIESSYNVGVGGGLRSLSRTGKKHFDNYIGTNATGNIAKDGPEAYKALTGEDPPFVVIDTTINENDNESIEDWTDRAEPSEVFASLFKANDFEKFCINSNQKFNTTYDQGRIKTYNSAGKARSAWLKDLFKALEYMKKNYDLFENSITHHSEFTGKSYLTYSESPYRTAYDKVLPLSEFDEIYSWAVEQTPSFTETINKLVGFTLKRSDCSIKKQLLLTYENLEDFLDIRSNQKEDIKINFADFNQIVLQPCSSLEAKNNFADTIENEISLTSIKKELNKKDYIDLSEISETFGFWGVVNVAPATWKRLEEGALVLFFANRKAFATATVVKKFINFPLASKLWGQTEEGNAFQHMYALKDMQYIEIPQSLFNLNLGYKENFIVQRFQVLERGPSSIVLSAIAQMNTKKENTTKRGSGWGTCDSCGVTFLEIELKNNICPTC